ncbi:MAG: T9SS type A sorting domain-containing protein, partial [Flavobacteriales bacterium]
TSGDSFTFNATGSGTILWYDAMDANTPVGEGPSFTTNPITSNSSFYVSNANVVPGEEATGGKDVWTENGNGQYQNNSNYYLIFDANNDMTITSVDVYAQGAADRTIAVEDATGNTVATTTVAIPDGLSTVSLGFDVPQGTGYSLRLVGNNPQIWRDKDLNNNFAYPFVIGSLATITGTNVGGADFDNYYYYFYNWVVEAPDQICESERTEVTALVGLNENSSNDGLSIYPNPVLDRLTINIPSNLVNSNVVIRDQFGKTVYSSYCSKSSIMNIDCNGFASGVYMVDVFNPTSRFTEKFIVK